MVRLITISIILHIVLQRIKSFSTILLHALLSILLQGFPSNSDFISAAAVMYNYASAVFISFLKQFKPSKS